MRSQILTLRIATLHLRIDAPMPSELKEAHARIYAIQMLHQHDAEAKILRFKRNGGGAN